MKLIQLNVWCFNCGDDLLDFVSEQRPDILNLQEVVNPDFEGFGKNVSKQKNMDYFERLKNSFGFNGVFAPSFGVYNESGSVGYFGNAFLTNLPILDYFYIYDKPLEIISLNHNIYNSDINTRRIGSFRLPTNILISVLQIKNITIRNITTHFHVTEKCTETLQTVEHAERVCNLLENSKPIPTILSGDFNIHPQSYSIKKISEYLEMVNKNCVNSLNPEIHPAIINGDLPNGVVVDYVFQTGFSVKTVDIPQITVSDHLPIIVELDI